MTGTKESNVYLASKPRYEILDGLRGVAAVFVLVYHLCETHFGLGAAHPLNHGYLAVDFFFALSGFVKITKKSAIWLYPNYGFVYPFLMIPTYFVV